MPVAVHDRFLAEAPGKGQSVSGHLLERLTSRDLDLLRLQAQVKVLEDALAQTKAELARTDALVGHYSRILGQQTAGAAT